MASSIAGARLVALDSSNHIVLEDEPAWAVFLSEVEAFVRPDRDLVATPVGTDPAASMLSARELDVLTLAARGHDNDVIASGLRISVRTVERHLHNIYSKLDLHGKSARTAAVARLLTHT